MRERERERENERVVCVRERVVRNSSTNLLVQTD